MTKLSKAARYLTEVGLRVGDDALHTMSIPSRYDGKEWHYDCLRHLVRITGVGESVVIVRRKGRAEFAVYASELSAFNDAPKAKD